MIYPFDKTTPSLSLYNLTMYREMLSPLRFYRPLRSFLWMCFSELVHVNSQLHGFACYIFSGACNLLLPLVTIYTAVFVELLQASQGFVILSGPAVWRVGCVSISQHSELGKTKTNPLSSPFQNQSVGHMLHFSLLP